MLLTHDPPGGAGRVLRLETVRPLTLPATTEHYLPVPSYLPTAVRGRGYAYVYLANR